MYRILLPAYLPPLEKNVPKRNVMVRFVTLKQLIINFLTELLFFLLQIHFLINFYMWSNLF